MSRRSESLGRVIFGWALVTLCRVIIAWALLTLLYAVVRADDTVLLAATRAWESRMGLPAHPVRFETGLIQGTHCGLATLEGITYSRHRACRHWRPRELAAHETCHLRMLHPYLSLSHAVMEREVATCVRWYTSR
jgi:hypothetical protein